MPNLYPDLDALALEQFLPNEAYALIRRFDNVYILPFAGERSAPRQKCFGLGLSRLMIRNLMLLRNISIHGPEDTAQVTCEAAADLIEANARSSYVTGIASHDDDGYSLTVEVHRRRRPVQRARIRQDSFPAFLRECSYTIAELLGSTVRESAARAWKVAQPRAAGSLVKLGKIHLDFDRRQVAERGRAAQRLLDDDPDFIVPMWDIDEELPYARQEYFEGLERDPYNAQLCFTSGLLPGGGHESLRLRSGRADCCREKEKRCQERSEGEKILAGLPTRSPSPAPTTPKL